jgi:hypothetical protein
MSCSTMSNNATFTPGVDYLVKLTGTTNLDLSQPGSRFDPHAVLTARATDTLKQLMAWTAVHGGVEPNAATVADIQTFVDRRGSRSPSEGGAAKARLPFSLRGSPPKNVG